MYNSFTHFFMKKIFLIVAVSLFLSTLQAQNDPVEWKVQTNKTVSDINPDMYGIFFEDINFGADGGLYAELIKNRSFEFPQNLMGWKIFGKVELRTIEAPFERNPHYVRLYPSGHAHKHTGLENEGFRGIGLKEGATYRFSVWARSLDGKSQTIRIEFIDAQNNVMDKRDLSINSKEWQKYSVEITASGTEPKALLRLFLDSRSQNAVDLEHISLFPKDTWMDRENGLRKDLAQALADLKPGVFRFPGGCIVEGTDLETRYNWKNSVGPVENRPLNENRWHYTFTNRFFPDYFQSYGLGFFEFFQLAEDIGAEALPVLSVGLACQFQNNNMSAHVAVEELNPYVQDALDLIEFANGPADSKWGKLRADMGHPEPFNMKYLGIGNEQWGPEFPERLEVFVNAIRLAYPDIQIIGSSGPSAEGEQFEYLWPEMKRLKVDLVDEHYYKDPNWFFANATRYDKYDRKGPKVFAGEYASHDHPRGKANNFRAALSEACFMTGLERNADVVRLATYAPLFAHVDAWQWNPDLIWFDNLRSVRTPNWYIQQLYSLYKGTEVLRAVSGRDALSGKNNLYASAVRDAAKKEIILKIGNSSNQMQRMKIELSGLKKFNPDAKWIAMQANDLNVVNTLDEPFNIVPGEAGFVLTGPVFDFVVKPQSFNVLVIKEE